MAQITFNERDLSWYSSQRARGQLSVLMPGVSTFGPYEPTLVNSDNFVTTLGDTSVDSRDLSYQMAASFVNAGADVLFWRIPLENSAPSVSYAYKDIGTYTVDSTSYPVAIRFRAKYAGSYGNNFEVKVVNTGSSFRVIVYNLTNNTLLDNFLVNFSSYDNENFYKTVNLGTQYVEIDIGYVTLNQQGFVESFTPIDKFDILPENYKNVEGSYRLVNGSNGIYDEVTITDYISSSSSNSLFSELTDVLSYDFNTIINSGYNSYSRRVDTVKLVKDSSSETDLILEGVNPSIINQTSTYKLTYGSSDLTSLLSFNSSNVVVTPTSEEQYNSLLGNFADFTYSLADGLNSDVISQIDDKFIWLAEKRGTAIYLVDGSKDWTAEQFYMYTGLPSNSGDYSLSLRSSRGFNTSYAAAYGPWCSAVLASNGVTRQVPGSYVLIMSWANSLSLGTPIYYAPAGVKRASLNFVKGTEYQVGSAILDVWQNHSIIDTDSHKINPITKLRQYGYVIYGNSTLLKSSASGATSMLQSVSTRVLANMIKLRAFDISLSLQFDQISDDLFLQFNTLMTEYMDQLKYSGSLYSYQILAGRAQTTLDDINNRTVPVIIRISPNPAAENFEINLEISQSGVDFDEDTYQS